MEQFSILLMAWHVAFAVFAGAAGASKGHGFSVFIMALLFSFPGAIVAMLMPSKPGKGDGETSK